MAEKMNPMHTFALAGVPEKDLPHKLAKLACDEYEQGLRGRSSYRWGYPDRKVVAKILQQYTPRGKRGKRLPAVLELADKHWRRRRKRRMKMEEQDDDYLLFYRSDRYDPEKMVERMLGRLPWRRPEKYETEVSKLESFTGENFRRLHNVFGLPLAVFCDQNFYTRADESDDFEPKGAGVFICDDAVIIMGLERMKNDDDRGPLQEAVTKLISLANQLNRCIERRKK